MYNLSMPKSVQTFLNLILQEDVLSVLVNHLDESALQSHLFLVGISGTSIDEEHISEQVQIGPWAREGVGSPIWNRWKSAS